MALQLKGLGGSLSQGLIEGFVALDELDGAHHLVDMHLPLGKHESDRSHGSNPSLPGYHGPRDAHIPPGLFHLGCL